VAKEDHEEKERMSPPAALQLLFQKQADDINSKKLQWSSPEQSCSHRHRLLLDGRWYHETEKSVAADLLQSVAADRTRSPRRRRPKLSTPTPRTRTISTPGGAGGKPEALDPAAAGTGANNEQARSTRHIAWRSSCSEAQLPRASFMEGLGAEGLGYKLGYTPTE
jgi:hypothetical protein